MLAYWLPRPSLLYYTQGFVLHQIPEYDRLTSFLQHYKQRLLSPWQQIYPLSQIRDLHNRQTAERLVERIGIPLSLVWIMLLGSMPVVLLLVVAGIANITLEWLMVAGITGGITVVLVLGLWGYLFRAEFATVLQRLPRYALLRAVLGLSITLALLTAVLINNVAFPPSLWDIVVSVAFTLWFIGIFIRIAALPTLKNQTKSFGDRVIALGLVLLSSIAIMIVMASYAFSLTRYPIWHTLYAIEQISQLGAIVLGVLHRTPLHTTLQSRRLRIVLGLNALYTHALTSSLHLDIPFIPHITIGSNADPLVCKQIADQINQQHIEIHGTITALNIISGTVPVTLSLESIPLTRRS